MIQNSKCLKSLHKIINLILILMVLLHSISFISGKFYLTSELDHLICHCDRGPWFINGIKIIRWCFVPLIIVGTITNIINIVVFSKQKLRSLSTGKFLLILAIADLSLIYFQVSVQHFHVAICC